MLTMNNIANFGVDVRQSAVLAVFLTMTGLVGNALAAPGALSAEQARHLLGRTGFSPTETEVQALVGLSAQAAVDRIVDAALVAKPVQSPPDFVSQPPLVFERSLKTPQERNAFRRHQYAEGMQLKTWWMNEMLRTPTPLAERMAVFWHNHFATSQQKVPSAQAMWNQHQLFRQNALGSFKTMLHAVAKDPAMLIYLDGANSRKEAPNENFAREVMELFVLGEASQGGGYTEADIKAAARAFTGWSVNRDNYTYQFRPAFYDAGSKTLLGKTGNFTGEQVLDLLLAQPAAPRFLAEKLWKEFVAPMPAVASAPLASPLHFSSQQRARQDLGHVAAALAASQLSIAPALKVALLTDTFWDPVNRGSLVKSPVELVAGTVRQFGFRYTDATPFVIRTQQLGQNLLFPPNVKGWPGYTDWINATTLLERKRFSEGLFRAVELKTESSVKPLELAAAGRPADLNLRALLRSEFGDAGAPARASSDGAAGLAGAGNGMDRATQVALRAVADRQGREGLMRVAQDLARITFDPEGFLGFYGGHADREPTPEVRARLEQAMLAIAPTQVVAEGTVGVAYLRSLTLDPAYQLK